MVEYELWIQYMGGLRELFPPEKLELFDADFAIGARVKIKIASFKNFKGKLAQIRKIFDSKKLVSEGKINNNSLVVASDLDLAVSEKLPFKFKLKS